MRPGTTTTFEDPGLQPTFASNRALDAQEHFDLETHVTAHLDWYHEIVIGWRAVNDRVDFCGETTRDAPGTVRNRRPEGEE